MYFKSTFTFNIALFYTVTTAAALFIGLGLALWFNPGNNITLPNVQVDKPTTPNLSDVLLEIVPENIFQAFTVGNVMAIIFLAIIMGIAISSLKLSSDSKMVEHGHLIENSSLHFKKCFTKF